MSDTLTRFHVIVVGGGLVGKTAALALSQGGLRVALLAMAAPPAADEPFDSRVYALSASSQALFERVRVWQALDLTRVAPVYKMQIIGDAAAELHFSAFQATVPRLAWIAEAALIERALDAALRFQPQLTWLNARAQHLTVSKCATLALDRGSALEAELVIGADGAHSWVRAQIGAKVNQCDYQQAGVVANFRAEKPHGETAFQWFLGNGEVLALLPLPGPYVSLVWSASNEHAQQLISLDGAQLAACVEQATGKPLGALECVTRACALPLSRQTVDKLIAPRIALVGDAAHVIHPLAGQGMNLGLRDVATLLDVIAAKEGFRDLGDLMLLRRYERARREDIYRLLIATDGLKRLFALPGPLARRIRNAGMAFVDMQPMFKRWLVANALSY